MDIILMGIAIFIGIIIPLVVLGELALILIATIHAFLTNEDQDDNHI